MVILKKLYSETGLFDAVKFKEGINIVLGEYTKPKEERSEINGIGKSTLVRLIDYALLSDSTRNKYFNINRSKTRFLEGHSITLELDIDGETHFIKRAFDEPRTALFGKDLSKLQAYHERELGTILGNLFFGKDDYQGYFEPEWFRRLIRFFIKDDKSNYIRRDPLKFSSSHINDFEAYVYNLFLLGLPNSSVGKFDEFRKNRDDLTKQSKSLSKKLKEETGKEIEQINSEIRLLDNKIRSLEKAMSEYKFLESYKDVESELVKLTSEISEKLRQINLFNRQLNEYKQSYEYEIEIDRDKISRIYGEIRKVFGDTVRKTVDEVFAFRKQIAEGRERFLKSKEVELTTEIDKLTSSISSLEVRRSDLFKLLDEQKALDSIKSNYSLLIEDKTKKERLSLSIGQLNKLDDEKNKLTEQISNTITEIKREISNVDEQINKLYSIFLEIVAATVRVPDLKEVVFDVRPYSNMRTPFRITIDVPKSDALGKSRLKVIAYDLTVFL